MWYLGRVISKSTPLGSSTTCTWPPWSWAAQRAMESPRPVPPDSVPGPAFPLTNRRKMSVRASGGICDPKLITLATTFPFSRSSWACTRTVVPSAECFRAFDMMLVKSWRSRSWSPSMVIPSSKSTWMSWACPASAIIRGSTVSSMKSAKSKFSICRLAAPASIRERSRRKAIRSERRWAWSRIPSRLAGVGSVTPSAMFSTMAWSAETGVRSSWLTFATMSRRIWSACWSSSAISLKDTARSPTSSRLEALAWTRTV